MKLKSYVKDTTDFIQRIEAIDHVSDDSYLVSLNVRSLYTNTPHEEGIEDVKTKVKEIKAKYQHQSHFNFFKTYFDT